MAAEAGSVEIPVIPDLTSFGVLLASGLRGSMGSIQGVLQGITKNFGLIAAAGIAAGAGASIKAALEYEESFRRIDAVTEASTQTIGAWKEQLLNVASETAQAPKELADAMYFLASAGIGMDKVMNVLQLSAKASAIGLGDTQTVALLTAQAMNAFSDQGLTATDAMDALTAAVVQGAVEPDALAASLGRVMPAADAVGLSFAEVTAGISAMTNAGLDAYESTTALRQLLLNVAAPSVEAASAMLQIGLSSQRLRAELQENGLLGALDLLAKKSHMNFDVLRRIIPNVRALTGVLNLSRAKMAQLTDITDEVTNSAGDFNEAWRATQDNVSFQVEKLGNNFDVLKVRAGEALLPLVNMVVNLANTAMPVLSLLANNAHLVIAAFIGWKALPFIISAVADALNYLGASVVASDLSKVTNLRTLYTYLSQLITRVPGIGSLVTALGGLGAAVGTVAAVAGGANAIFKSLNFGDQYDDVVKSAGALKIYGEAMKLPAELLDQLQESSTGFAHNAAVLGSQFTYGLFGGDQDLFGEFQDKVDTIKASIIQAARAGASLSVIRENLTDIPVKINDVFKSFAAGSPEARDAITDLIDGTDEWAHNTEQDAAIASAALAQGALSMHDILPEVEGAEGALAAAGYSAREFGIAVLEAAQKGPTAFNKFQTEVRTKLEAAFADFANNAANSMNFANDALSSFIDHSGQSVATLITNFGKASDKTKQYGKDLLEISRNGGEQLANALLASGTAGASAAHRIATSADSARDHVIGMYNKISGQAQETGGKLATAILGTLNQIYDLLTQIASHGWEFNVNANLAAAQSSLSHFITEWDGKQINIAVGVTTPSELNGALGGWTNDGKALGGPVRGRTPYLVGEKGPELFVPNGSGTIVPNNKLRTSAAPSGGTQVNVTLSRRRVLDELDRQVRYAGR